VATVIDCHTKAVIGWAIGGNYKTPLIEAAIEMAARNHRLAPGAIFHHDRGSNYTSCQFAATLKRPGIRQYETSPLRTQLPDPRTGPRRVPEPAAHSVN
jgi:putative transposase